RSGRLHAAERIPHVRFEQLGRRTAERAGRIQMILVVVIAHVRGRASASASQHRARLKGADALVSCKHMKESLAWLLLVNPANPNLQLGLVFALPEPGPIGGIAVFRHDSSRLREA